MIEYELLALSYETYIEENNIEDTEKNKNMWNAALLVAQVVSVDYMALDQINHCKNRIKTIAA
jgi:hypothetical protein